MILFAKLSHTNVLVNLVYEHLCVMVMVWHTK